MARRYASAAHAAEVYVELLSKLTSAGGVDYTDVRVEGGVMCTEPEGLDDLMALEYAIGEVIFGRMEKALVWKDMLFLNMSSRQAAAAHNKRAQARRGRTICKDTALKWTYELNGRFEEILSRNGSWSPNRSADAQST